ncbi:unnamed protein product [Rhizoctonia solani]|uniref:Uncharacterized protein n=1 Tax=Rhizoctonia solani TaxID=456999 RepID=A0A8H2XWK7_9AGAM|nr:unnamed protein product [Rhizoctonia solani]
MRQPTCLRCEEGGLECLGYSHNRRGVARSSPLKVLKTRSILPKGEEGNVLLLAQPTVVSSRSKSNGGGCYSGRSSSVGDPSSFNELTTELIPSSRLHHSDPGTLVQQQDCGRKGTTIQDYLKYFSPRHRETRTPALSPSLHQLFLAVSRLPSSPSNPIMAYLNGPEFESYVVSHFYRMMDYAYFKPVQDQADQLQSMICSRLRNSHLSQWIMLICARICEDIIDGDRSQTGLHIRSIGDIEATLWTRLCQDPTPREAEDLRGDWLEVSLLKTALGGGSNAYVVLRKAAPTFLQATYSLPDLWSNNSDPAFIPFVNIVGSEHHTLSSFILIDCTCAMMFGLPQQVEYDTNIGQIPKGFLSNEWAHSSPLEFQVLLADINACRDKSPKARDWREIEYTLVHWETQVLRNDAVWESWMAIAWLAVQESWRLALLAYLYLAVCGLPSDDPHIQTCITQILQVVGTVKKHESPDINVPFLIQYLIVGICARSEKQRKITRNKFSNVGICARSEKQRKITRNKFSNVTETKFWMIRGEDFVPVLDHLWHGAGSGGRPVTWADYVRSREAVLPIPI